MRTTAAGLTLSALLIVSALLRSGVPLPADEKPDFPAPPNTQPAKDVLSTPAEALASFKMPEGFSVSLFAAEPDVQNPISITTDERGRIWIAENYTYAEQGFAKELRDRVVILEDADGDGKFDKRTVFWDKAFKLTSVEVGHGGVWLLCAPQLLFIPDKNRDDVPDGPPVVILDGWEDTVVHHNIVNGLRWGPDGWLYGRHGIQASSLVGKPGASESQRTRLNACVWRYHPQRDVFEVVAQGGTNSWGFDWDEHGQMFFINTVIGHLWHVVPGAHYKRMYGTHFNPHLYQLIDQTADHIHWDAGETWQQVQKGASRTTDQAGGGHAHSGMMIYQGDNWPAKYRNTLFTVNLHGHRLNNDRIQRQGAGYVGKHSPDFLSIGDAWFRGIELLSGPDGGVFLIDWTDVGECHERDGVHRTSGRIFKITYGTPKPVRALDLAAQSDSELVKLHANPNDWYARQARRLLQERAVAGRDLSAARGELLKLFEGDRDMKVRLRALWSLWSIGAIDEGWLTARLQDPEEHVRTWAVKLLVDKGELSQDVSRQLAMLVEREKTGLAQLFLASALPRIPATLPQAPWAERWSIGAKLARRSEFANDPVLPLMIWYGIESLAPRDAARAAELVRSTSMPLVRKHLARRLTAEMDQRPEGANLLTAALLARDDSAFRLDVLQGMTDALRGWRKATAPKGWTEVAAVLERDSSADVKARARDLSVVFGDGRATDELRKIVSDGQADPEGRRLALRTLIDTGAPDLLPLLNRFLGDRDLGREAVRGLAAFDVADIPGRILGTYPRLDPDARSAAIDTLVSRPAFAKALLEAVAAGRIGRRDLSAFHARQIRSLDNPEVTALLAKVWGEARATSDEKRGQIARQKELLTPARLAGANLPAGRALFVKSCANCHVLYGQGKSAGPDLTGSNRRNLDYLLENLIDPSASVAADFRMSVAQLKSGRVVTGVVVEQSERTITLQTQQDRVTIQRADIEEQKATAESLMPEGLLKDLSEDQVRDLFGYLMSTEQVPLP